MKILNRADPSLYTYRDPVKGGEYSGFMDNTMAAIKGMYAGFGESAERSYMSDLYRPLVEEYQTMSGLDAVEMGNVFDNPNYTLDPTGKGYKGLEYTNEKLFELAQKKPEYKQYLQDQGINVNSAESMYNDIYNRAVADAEVKVEEQRKTSEKQSTLGKIGGFLGGMIGVMGDESDLAATVMPIGASWKLTSKIIANTGAIAGVELYEYDQVKKWHQAVTGEDYTRQDMIDNIAMGAGLGAGLTAITHLPLKSYFKYTEGKLKRALTPKERIEGIEALRQAWAEQKGFQYKPDEELQMGLDKQEALDITDRNNLFPNDTNNTSHNAQTIQFFRHLLDNDLRAMERGPNAGLNVSDDIRMIEKEYSSAIELDPNMILLDKDTFQFKKFKEKLPEGTQYDPVLAGNVIVYEDAAGKRILVDGHTRVELAKQDGKNVSAIILKESDNVSKEMARITSVFRNALDRSISARDMKVFKSYPGLEELVDSILPTYRNNGALAQLSAKGFVAFTRGIVSEDVAKLVSETFKTEFEQIAMFDMIKKSGLKNIDNIEKLIRETKNLSGYDMSTLSKDLKGLDFIPERNAVINDMVKYLERENAKIKQESSKLDKSSGEYIINKSRSIENENLIKLIRAYGDEAGSLSDEITDAAVAIRNGEGFDITSNTTLNNLRKRLSEGAFDGALHRANIARGNSISEVSRLSKQVADESSSLKEYMDGASSTRIQEEVASMRQTLMDEQMTDPRVMKMQLLDDENGNPRSLESFLDDMKDIDRHLEYINRCRK